MDGGGLCRSELAPGGVPTKNLRAPRGVRLPAASLASIASKLAPTGDLSRSNDIELRRKRIEAGHQLPELLAIALQFDQALLDRRGDVQLLEADLFQGGLAHGHAGIRLGVEAGAVGQHAVAQG